METKRVGATGLTYKEWQQLGRHVKKGEHCVGRNEEGVPVFTHTQTAEYKNPRYAPDQLDDDALREESAFFESVSNYFDDIGDR